MEPLRHCIVLYCIVLYCIVLFVCFVLYSLNILSNNLCIVATHVYYTIAYRSLHGTDGYNPCDWLPTPFDPELSYALTLCKHIFCYVYVADVSCTSRCKIIYFTAIFLHPPVRPKRGVCCWPGSRRPGFTRSANQSAQI
jgi:hypothetical protein